MCSRAMAQSVQHQGQRLNRFDPDMELRAVMLSILVWSIQKIGGSTLVIRCFGTRPGNLLKSPRSFSEHFLLLIAEIVEKDVQFEKILQNKPAPPCLYPVTPLAQSCQSPAAKSAHQPLPSESPCSLRELGKV